MDDNLENAAQEFERDLNDAAENAWKPVEDSAEQVAEAAESVEGGWSEVKDDFHQASAETWSAPEIPQAPIPPQPEANRWGAPVNEAADDPGRWNDNLYTPGADQPAQGEPYVAQEAPKVIDYVATPPAQPEKKDKFPVWAIVLIVLLVLCICIALPIILLIVGLGALFTNITAFLPILFI
ncbi:MAG TPA: hypothetical protein PKY64_03660 [Anaerolineaceae bacterium]|nr:hypothetical protein [Anaerolineaceae bacterium]